MAKLSALLRILLLLFVTGLLWYTVQLYANVFGYLDSSKTIPDDGKVVKVIAEINKNDVKGKENLDFSIDRAVIEEAEKQWEKNAKLPVVQEKLKQFKCDMQQECSESEFTFRITSGAANVIGPSICFDGKWIMRNALNNVDRGMNVAIVNGRTGKAVDKGTFDLYGKDSSEVKKFLKKLGEEDLVMVTTYDDAAFRLDDEARNFFLGLGSQKVKELAFRDNWVFVGGKKLKHPSQFEHIIVNDKTKNKFGDWPDAISVEGCIPKL